MQYINEYKKRLKEKRKKLIKSINNLSDDESLNFRDSIGNLSNYDNHPADIGSELYEREKDLGLKDNNINYLKRIDEALLAIEKGDYGFCENCGKKISKERLDATPSTLKCRQCSGQNENEGFRSREIAHHSVGSNSSDDYIADKDEAWKEVEKHGTSSSELEHYNPDDFED